MTRTDVMASSRPRTAGTTAKRSSKGRRVLLVLPVLLVTFALMLPGIALAAGEATSGYNEKPSTPTTSTSPSKEKEAPKEEPAKEAAPTTEKASTLPFTGFDLRWSLVIGVVLLGAGFSIVTVQRRHRGGSR